MTKNEQILEYIRSIAIGTKISVRQIATDMGVSEGTAYKAIKDAELLQLVSTMPRVGTIRVEKIEKKGIQKLTFAEVLHIVEGTVLGGHEGIYKTFNKFVIGAMAIDEIKRYLSDGDMLIVGNRDDAHKLALDKDCAVLITGGFSCRDEIKRIANEKKLPIISTSHDTFSVTSILNRDIHERLIRKEILMAEDIMPKDLYYIEGTQSVGDLKKKIRDTGHSRFPVVDSNRQVIGIVTPRDIAEAKDHDLIKNLMTQEPIIISKDTPVAYISHVMIWEGIEMIPLVEGKRLVGVITRQDVIRGLKYIRSQPHLGETFEDTLLHHFKIEETEKGIRLVGDITPMMLNELGIASAGVLVMLMSAAGSFAIKKEKQLDSVIDSFMIYFIRPLQMENTIEIYAEIINVGRKFYKVDIFVKHQKEIVSKAMMSAKILKK
ncbi:Predicted transcriptional regulator containing CBS domains [Geosporobacter subterraneus DSM 17957]|uniref:Predicted transcriptional regulator containing CBS domains n=1 Tax=Geosporobacter subterraneus DSM 17957 TaxID=1121919 RepID=A0A1M6JCP9_9FIRM|nr:DRTGG domain-containing protein [Geosporobacter subterraneus]SHJ44495.1 Predicted transcriptional regulator containing CBS domains [Geosporobacter subterraneus DSM 17957]